MRNPEPGPAMMKVPWYRGRLEPLPKDRRRAFTRYLRTTIRDALEGVPGRPSRARRITPSPRLEQAAVAGCATCGGHCCSRGDVHAYLDDDSIRRVARAYPKLGARGLAALYLTRLPARSFTGSCVFHGESGCVLPRELRADLCNAFYCTGLLHFFRDHAELQADRVRIEAKQGEYVRAVSHLDLSRES
jgi:hypothetical protein